MYNFSRNRFPVLATPGYPNLKMPKNRYFFIIRYLISRIFVIFFMHVRIFVFSLFSSPNNNFDVYWPFRPAKCKKIKNAFEFPAKTRVNIVRNITLFSPLDSWHQDLEFGPQMDIFGPIEPEYLKFLYYFWSDKK